MATSISTMAVAGEQLQLLDAEVEEFLLPGDFVLIFYRNDSVWHERAVLWKFGDRWEVITPDKDRYLEVLKPGRKGPLKLVRLNANGACPAGLKEAVYRFKDYPSIELHNKRLKESFEDALRIYGGLVTVFPLVKDADGVEVGADLIVGRRAASRRVTGKTGALAPAGAAPAIPSLPSRPSKGDGWREKLRIADGAPEDSAWVLAETVDDIL